MSRKRQSATRLRLRFAVAFVLVLVLVFTGIVAPISHIGVTKVYADAIVESWDALEAAVRAGERIDGSETAAGAEGKSGKQHFWERILYAIPSDRLQESDFSEFETYGTYCALRHMGDYALREWHSFRLGGEFFDTDTISERDFAWLSRDFDAISFEKGHKVREDHRNLFDNPAYQEKLSPRQMLESIQDLFNGGYVEVWGTSGKQTGGAE